MLEMGGQEIGALGAWIGLLAFTFQLFFDFAGYSDMAIGLGKMFGFQYLRNFNYPYISRSITEFWRRWHISLSSFFRDYVYISLGGNRVKQPRWIFNLSVVWILTGVWHGAAWNYILWGLYYLAILLLEKFVWGKALKSLPIILQHLYAILIFMFGWLLFWIEDMGQMWIYFQAMFGVFGITGTSTLWELTIWEYWPVFIVCIFASTPIIPWLRAKLVAWASGTKLMDFWSKDLPGEKTLETSNLCDYDFYTNEIINSANFSSVYKYRLHVFNLILLLVDIALLVILVLAACSVISGSFNPFIYFRF